VVAKRRSTNTPPGAAVEPRTLYVVSTPIGNLADASFRALQVLRDVQIVLAEDTRQTRVLFDRYDLRTPMQSLHEHNEATSVAGVLKRLSGGDSIAIVSDAGTPLISDPGERLVRAVWEAGFRVVPIPGPTAMAAALAAAGMETARFTFFGFLPKTGRERTDALRELSVMPHTGVVYESPERVVKTLLALVELGCGQREAVVARELTKRFEEFKRGTVSSLATYYDSSPPRGEVVLLIEGRREPPVDEVDEMKLRDRVRAMRAAGATTRDITSVLVTEYGVARNYAYRLAHDA